MHALGRSISLVFHSSISNCEIHDFSASNAYCDLLCRRIIHLSGHFVPKTHASMHFSCCGCPIYSNHVNETGRLIEVHVLLKAIWGVQGRTQAVLLGHHTPIPCRNGRNDRENEIKNLSQFKSHLAHHFKCFLFERRSYNFSWKTSLKTVIASIRPSCQWKTTAFYCGSQ